MKCPKCEKEMLYIQNDGKDYHICQDCKEVHRAEQPSDLSTGGSDTILQVLLGFVLFTIVAVLSGFIIWGISETSEAQQAQSAQTAAVTTKTLTRSDLIKQGKIKVKKQTKKSADPSPDTTTITDTGSQPDNAGQDTGNGTSPQPTEQMVWLTETGKKYHIRNDCGFTNPDKAYQVPISYAEAHSNGPCKICFK